MSARLCSIHLGSHTQTYQTEKNSAEDHAGQNQQRTQISQAHVTALNTASFSLGNENLNYSTTNTLADPTGNMGQYTAVVKDNANRKSNLSLGSEKGLMQSTAQFTNRYDSAAGIKETSSRRADCKNIKQSLAKTNFSLGDDAPIYTSVAHACHDGRMNARIVQDPANQADLRGSHFQMGIDPTNYATSNKMNDTTAEIRKNRNKVQDLPTAKTCNIHL